MSITPLPNPPSRSDPSNFSERADAFMGALPAFATETNATAVDVNDDAVAAAASAVDAAVSATAANASANVSKWVSGTTYDQGDVEWSPINFFSYRRKVAGAGTTDPSADPTNWALVSGAGDVSLTGVQTLSNKTLTSPIINTPIINTPTINTPTINTATINTPTINSINGGQLAGMRNLLINGNLSINQRGYVSGTATSGANQYTLDRWRVVTSGQALTFTASGNGNSMAAPAGGVEQVIEGANIGGGTYVLGWTGTATATVNGTARAKGAAFTLPANTNATVRLIGGTASLVQLEPGGTVTPFEHRSIGMELALCQRYFEVVSGFGIYAYQIALTTALTSVGFKTEKRAAPTMGVPTVANLNNANTIAAYTVTTSNFSFGANAISTGVVQAWNASVTASAEL